MQTTKHSPFLKGALGLVAVAITYSLAATCYQPNGAVDPCRNVISSTPSETVIISEQTCTLDTDSYLDDLVGSDDPTERFGQPSWSKSYDSVCGVAYDCPPPVPDPIVRVGYYMNSAAWVLYHNSACP